MEMNEDQECPVCGRSYSVSVIERHVNKCLFLNGSEIGNLTTPKRKRSSSPSLLNISSSSSNSPEDLKNPSSVRNKYVIQSNTKRRISTQIVTEVTLEKNEVQESPIRGRNLLETHVKKSNNKNIKSQTESNITNTKNLGDSTENLDKFSDLLQFESESLAENKMHSNKTIKIENKDIHPFFSSKYNINKKASVSNDKTSKNKVDSNETVQNCVVEDKDRSFLIPLAKQLQPKTLDDFVGQNHVFGEDSVLRTLLGKGEIPNMILWGPPGCGKTSLAGVIQELCKSESKRLRFVSFCAANSGVKDVQNVVTTAKNELRFGHQTVLFMDEIHRFNKRQQDSFLIHVEKGEIILVGATTENPSFSINNALLSRCRVIVFEKLETEALVYILIKALKNLDIHLIEDDNPCKYDCNEEITKLSIEKSALIWLADTSDGDARIALSNLQLVLQHNTDSVCILTIEDIKEEVKKSHLMYDRKGEEHYNLISALHKSIRASDANAALYWLTRMTLSGEDPIYIARRLVRAASEDIGNDDPNALQLAISTMQGCQLLGMPECDVLLAQCTIYLARAPKSREADTALALAKEYIKNFEGPQPNVPMHLRNAPTKLMKDLGYGKLEQDSAYTCMPKGCEEKNFF